MQLSPRIHGSDERFSIRPSEDRDGRPVDFVTRLTVYRSITSYSESSEGSVRQLFKRKPMRSSWSGARDAAVAQAASSSGDLIMLRSARHRRRDSARSGPRLRAVRRGGTWCAQARVRRSSFSFLLLGVAVRSPVCATPSAAMIPQRERVRVSYATLGEVVRGSSDGI